MKYSDWWMKGGAVIYSPEEMKQKIDEWQKDAPSKVGPFVLTSGGFDPIHPGHLSCIEEARRHGPLIVVVNDDEFLKRKRTVEPCGCDAYSYDSDTVCPYENGDGCVYNISSGAAFMTQKVRCQIVSMLRDVMYVVPLKPSRLDDDSVNEALRIIQPDIFAKGGDRNCANIPEATACKELGIKILQGMGDQKHWSSSKFLESWGSHYVYEVYGPRSTTCLE